MGLSAIQLVIGVLTLASALMVVVGRNPVVSAVMLMVTLFLTGGLYFSLGSMFIGAVQILIYAGAISVLFVFIVMLLDLKPSILMIPGSKTKLGLACIAALILGGSLIVSTFSAIVPTGPAPEDMSFSSPQSISLMFLSRHMLAFQVTGLLLLVVVMGATLLGRPKRKTPAGER